MNNFNKGSWHTLIGMVASVVSFVSLLTYLPQAQAKQFLGRHHMFVAKKEKAHSADPIVVLETNKGTIKLQVFKNEAPITATNFLDLVQRGFYNGLTFHRYEPGFVIQGGDPSGTGTGNFIDPQTHQKRMIPLEVKANLRHDAAGVVAMARSSDPNSASCQFYITLAPASFLDGQYAVFGKVVDGMPVVQQLRAKDTMTKVYEQDSGK